MKKQFIVSLFALMAAGGLAAQSNWQHRGPYKNTTPGNVFKTGRADCIAFDPGYDDVTNKKMYAGSLSGGLWKSTDGGANWLNLGDGSPMYYGGVSAMTTDPNGVLYVADFNRHNSTGPSVVGSTGVYKYFPAGSWAATGSFPGVTQPFIINHIKVHPASAQIIFACTNQGLFRSINSGSAWTLVASGAYENVGFMPRTGGTGTYPYFVYASGDLKFDVSSNDGSAGSFTPVSCMTSYITQYATGYVDMAYTASTINPGEHYIYLYAYHKDAGGVTADYPYSGVTDRVYALYKFTYNSTSGAESCAQLLTYQEYDVTPDRMCVDAHDNVVYFGGVSILKFNTNYPLRLYQVNPSSFVESYYTPGSTPGYNVNGTHADQHDVVMRPAQNMLFAANDGGCFRASYVPANSPDDGQYIHTWAEKNMGLHISQIWGFSGSEEDPGLFMTGEADNYGFYTSSTTTYGTFGGETPGALMDKFGSSQRFYRGSAYSASVTHYVSGVTTLQSSYNTGSVSDECAINSYSTLGAPFTMNTLFQDPNRPQQFYYGTTAELNHWCSTNNLFTMKFRYTVFYNNTTYPSDPIKWATWGMVPKSMAFSRANKNKVYFCTTSVYDPTVGAINGAPQVYAFTGTDIDDAWIAHNENSWTPITPNFLVGGFMATPLPTINDAAQVQYAGVAVSDWNPDRVFLACQKVPLNPNTKVLKYESGTWTDYSTGIPTDEVPVSIVYEQGSNDYLYLGTNRSMYFRKYGMAAWQVYDTNLPRVASVQMQINYTENTVRTGTYGRGVWASQLMCPSGVDTLCSGTLSVNKFVEMSNSITAQNLTISNGDVKFRAGNYIDLLPDFQVTANATTTFFAFIHNCSAPGNTFRNAADADGDAEWMTAEEEEDEPGMEEAPALYPNPGDGHFFLQKNDEGTVRVEVYSIMGQQVYAADKVEDEQTEIDLSAQPVGVYLVRIISADRTRTIRVVKQ